MSFLYKLFSDSRYHIGENVRRGPNLQSIFIKGKCSTNSVAHVPIIGQIVVSPHKSQCLPSNSNWFKKYSKMVSTSQHPWVCNGLTYKTSQLKTSIWFSVYVSFKQIGHRYNSQQNQTDQHKTRDNFELQSTQ